MPDLRPPLRRLVQRTPYPAILQEAWATHLAPRADDAPTVISTFAGTGGSSLGYSMAGYRELLAVEWDDHAAQCFHTNFPEVDLYHGDIAQISVNDILSRTGLKPGELTVFDGSPPCQGFSTAGKRVMDDPRNSLFRQYVRILEGLQPHAFIMENVSGMVKGKMKLIFADILTTLKSCGYRVSARLLNAKYFHVPQARERMILLGLREDLHLSPSHPAAQSHPYTIAQALDGVRPETTPALSATYAPYWPHVPVGGSLGDVMQQRTGKQTHFSDLVKPDPRKPCCTIPKTTTGTGFATFVHWAEPRPLSIAEAKRLGSFPDPFVLPGDYVQQWARIGNCVPPLFMRAIAHHLRHLLDV